jgi:CDP-diglyceride synthetase
MLQRFVERLQLWWREREQEQQGKNPLTWLAIVALLLIGLDIYKIVVSHHFVWSAALSNVLLVAFLVLYTCHSPFAWLAIPAFGVIGLLQSPFMFFSSASHYPLRVRFLALAFVIIFSLAVIAYGFLVRRRYNIYLRDRSEVAPNI